MSSAPGAEKKFILSPEEEQSLCANSVDLIFEPDHVLIRPAPERMDLAFAADELLHGRVMSNGPPRLTWQKRNSYARQTK